MSVITPGGSASVSGGNAPLSFPLLPQGWPLTSVGGSDPLVAAAKVPQTYDPTNTTESTIFNNAMTASGNAGNRLL